MFKRKTDRESPTNNTNMLFLSLPNIQKSFYNIQLPIYSTFIKTSELKSNFKNHLSSELRASQCTVHSLSPSPTFLYKGIIRHCNFKEPNSLCSNLKEALQIFFENLSDRNKSVHFQLLNIFTSLTEIFFFNQRLCQPSLCQMNLKSTTLLPYME